MPRKRKQAEQPNELQRLILPIPDTETQSLLNTLKTWMEQRSAFQDVNFKYDYPALTLLLEGKSSDLVIQNPALAASQLKNAVSRASLAHRDQDDLLLSLEYALRWFAAPTEWEDCPDCNEGYLQYWVEPQQRKVLLVCPECGYEELLNGWEETGVPTPIFPALRQDYKWIAPIVQKKKGRLPDWKKPLPEMK